MRSRPPPEKVLNRSRMPPRVWSYKVCRISGLTPGSGMKLRKRNTISAPMVNQIRCLSSVALEKFARLRLLAMLSARDAMGLQMPCLAGRLMPPPPVQVSPYRGRAGMQEPPPENPERLFGGARLRGALLGRCEFGRIFRHDNFDGAASLLDGSDRALRGAGHLERNLARQLTLAEQPNAVL